MAAHELRRFALGAEAQVLQLHHVDDRIVVVGLHEIHVLRPFAGHGVEVVPVQGPAAAHLDGVLREGVVALDGGENLRMAQAQPLRPLPGHHEEALAPGAGHHAVEQMQGQGDGPGVQVLLHRQRLLEQGVGEAQGVGALMHAELAEILPLGTVLAHVMVGEEGEAGVRPAGAVGIDGVPGELAEAAQAEAKGIDVVGIPRDAGH